MLVQWYPRVRLEAKQNVPFVLVALKTNWRDDEGIREMLAKRNKVTVREDEGRRMAEEIGAVAYVEFAATVQRDEVKVLDSSKHAAGVLLPLFRSHEFV